MNHNTKKHINVILSLFLFIFSIFIFREIQIVRAEIGGGAPESGTDSRLTTLSTELISLNYGSTNAGSWGDWGSNWNRIYSAAVNPIQSSITVNLKNGGNLDYPKGIGGIEDYNNGGTIPDDSDQSVWITCNLDNNYCGTGRSVAEKKEENTGLVWSPVISTSFNWFIANNCQYPNGLTGDDGVCNTHNEIACKCVKLTSNKTGCEGYDDGNWRLPSQKELMMSYISGSFGNLSNPTNYYWSSTTTSYSTQNSWRVNQSYGYTNSSNKTSNTAVRCVR